MNPPVDAPASRARRPAGSTANRAERGRQLLAPAGHEAGWISGDHDGLVWCHEARGLGRGGPRHGDAAGVDRLACGLAAGDQPPAHQLGVEAPADGWRREPRGQPDDLAAPGAFFAADFLAGAFSAADFFAGRLLGGGLASPRTSWRSPSWRWSSSPAPSWPAPSWRWSSSPWPSWPPPSSWRTWARGPPPPAHPWSATRWTTTSGRGRAPPATRSWRPRRRSAAPVARDRPASPGRAWRAGRRSRRGRPRSPARCCDGSGPAARRPPPAPVRPAPPRPERDRGSAPRPEPG